MKQILLSILCCFSYKICSAQTLIGQSINGTQIDDQAYVVSMPDESTVAVGSYSNDINGVDAGNVRVFKLINNEWIPKGNSFLGEFPGDQTGTIDMPDSNTIAIGSQGNDSNGVDAGVVKVYSWNGQTWIQKGNPIYDTSAGWTFFGGLVKMADSNYIAVYSMDSNYIGKITTYNWNGSNWLFRGYISIGGAASADISFPDQNTIGISSDEQGFAKTYTWNGQNWIQKGQTITGLGAGRSISMPDSNTIAVGYSPGGINGDLPGLVRVFSWDGQNWIQKGNQLNGEVPVDHFGSELSMSDSNTIAISSYFSNTSNGSYSGRVRIYKWDNNSWVQYANDIYGENSGDVCGFSISTPSNNIIAVGSVWNDNSFTDAGQVRVYKLRGVQGIVFNDVNNNCLNESEMGLTNVNAVINPGNFIVQTNSSGRWSIDSLPLGNYTITIGTPNNWISSCPITQSFTVTNPFEITSGPDFGLISNNPCSDPEVSIYAPFLRPCLPNQMIYVSACNQSTATGSLNASYVDVELDPLMTVTGSSLPYTNQGNNIYRFQTGTLNPSQCVSFNITTTISCNAMLGQTLCMDANLFPVQSCALDTIPSDPIVNNGTVGTLNGFPQPCTLPWDQSSLSVDGWCANDSIYFTITNTGSPGGGDMECYSPMWITVDGVVTYTDSIMIPGGQTITLVYSGNGATWILNAEQHPLHPGNSHPNAHIEACGDTTNWTPDIVDDFPQDDADPVVDIYCGVVTGAVDPNDKTGYPIGQTDQKYIQPNQQLQYVIRFQNTGTDTAFTVVIRDTLDTDLNIFTVTSGVSSHQYNFRMYGPRVLEWTFNNINLPDSSTNSEGSNGFVTFHVEQVPNLAPGTEITNDADIYFDFNDPITTNTTMHRIYEGFVSVLNLEELTQKGKSLLVYPNPASNSITIKGETNINQPFSIFDQMGREVFKGKLTGTETEVNLSALSKGMYTLKIEGNFKPVQIVKE